MYLLCGLTFRIIDAQAPEKIEGVGWGPSRVISPVIDEATEEFIISRLLIWCIEYE